VARFSEESIAATGASIHIDHLIDAIASLSKAEAKKASARVFVANIEPALLSEVLGITWRLRQHEIPTQLYTGTNHILVPQLRYAEEYEIPVIVVYGPREHEKKLVSIRDMTVTGTDAQKTVPLVDVVTEVRRILDAIDSRCATTSSSDAAATGSTPSSSF
jgi:histidyl-tRNA synthetase